MHFKYRNKKIRIEKVQVFIFYVFKEKKQIKTTGSLIWNIVRLILINKIILKGSLNEKDSSKFINYKKSNFQLIAVPFMLFLHFSIKKIEIEIFSALVAYS